MFASLVQKIFRVPGKFLRDRRSVTAMTLAILAVPMFIAGEAAMNISRIVTARTLLQAAVDNAADAGVSAWHLSESPAYAFSVAQTTFKGAASNLSTFGAYSSPVLNNANSNDYCTSGSVCLACNGANAGSTTVNSTDCDQSGANTASYLTTPASFNCPNGSNANVKQYCVVVSASVTVNNWLFNKFIPSSVLSVTGYGQEGLTSAVNGQNVPPSPGFGSAGDVSGIYAYAVPMTGSGASTTPDFDETVAPSFGCSSYSSIGPLALLEQSNSTASACNYLFIALSTSSGTAGAGGSLTLQNNQPIAFTFVNYTGANGYHSSSYYQTPTNLEVYENNSSTGTYEPSGLSVTTSNNTYTTSTYQCSSNQIQTSGNGYYYSCPTTGTPTSTSTAGSGQPRTQTTCISGHHDNCSEYQTTVTTSSNTPYTATLVGQCPDHTLYGSLDSINVNSTTGANLAGIPVSDSLNVYSSAYEVLGEPPTYETNHALIPFLAPSSLSPASVTDVSGNTYTVRAVCPNYSVSGTSISAPINTSSDPNIGKSYAQLTGWTGLDIYSSAFPGLTYYDGAANPPEDTSGFYTSDIAIMMTNGSNDYYPPGIAGCTAAYNTYDGGVTSTASDPWWNWNASNSGAGQCGNESSTYTSSSTSATPPSASAFVATGTLPNGNQSSQPTYSNCALLIQDLGTAGGSTPTVPENSKNQALLPDFYLLVEGTPPSSTTQTIIGLDPVYDGKKWYDLMPGVIYNMPSNTDGLAISAVSPTAPTSANYVSDSNTAATYNTSGTISNAGFYPTGTATYPISSLTYKGITYSNVTVTVEEPAEAGSSYEFDLPPETSHQCYNPELNGNTTATNGVVIQAGQGLTQDFTATSGSTGRLPVPNSNGTVPNPVDPVANPQLGAILCNSNNPETYALYWNDLGTYGTDDLGYWNAITAFTCSVPGSSRSGGLATLSG
jgi:Flp pilus assembly protein TadG